MEIQKQQQQQQQTKIAKTVLRKKEWNWRNQPA